MCRPALAHAFREYDRLPAFFDQPLRDPVLAQIPLVEPWDVGAGGYEVGKLPG